MNKKFSFLFSPQCFLLIDEIYGSAKFTFQNYLNKISNKKKQTLMYIHLNQNHNQYKNAKDLSAFVNHGAVVPPHHSMHSMILPKIRS